MERKKIMSKMRIRISLMCTCQHSRVTLFFLTLSSAVFWIDNFSLMNLIKWGGMHHRTWQSIPEGEVSMHI